MSAVMFPRRARTLQRPHGLLAGTPPESDLLQASNLTYLGGIALPAGTHGASAFGADGGASCGMCIYRDGGVDTMFITGATSGTVAQISLPTPIIDSDWGDLNVATVLQNFVSVPVDFGACDGSTRMALGLLVDNGRLLMGAACNYNGDAGQAVSDSLALSTTNWDTWYQFDTGYGPRAIIGRMAEIPSEWQAAFGGDALTGGGCISQIGTSAPGPCAAAFTKADVGVESPIPVTPLMVFDTSHTANGTNDANITSTVYNQATTFAGLMFPSGFSTVAAVTYQGTGCFDYGGVAPSGAPYDLFNGSCGMTLLVTGFDLYELGYYADCPRYSAMGTLVDGSNVVTITSVTGTIENNMTMQGTGIPQGDAYRTYIYSDTGGGLTGTGGTGTYRMTANATQTVSSPEAIVGGDATNTCNDPVHAGKGPHCYPYTMQLLCYRAEDLLEVKAATRQVYDLTPYVVIPLTDSPYNNTVDRIAGACFGQVSNRLYLFPAVNSSCRLDVWEIGS